jgi:hypothetical protein
VRLLLGRARRRVVDLSDVEVPEVFVGEGALAVRTASDRRVVAGDAGFGDATHASTTDVEGETTTHALIIV